MKASSLARHIGWLGVMMLCCATGLAGDGALDSVAGTRAADNNGNAGLATEINIGEPFGVELGPDGALYITEVRNHRVHRLDLAIGEVFTVAGCGRRGYSGDGGTAVKAELNEPYEVSFDRDGNMYFVEMQNHVIRRVDGQSKIITTVAGTGSPGFSGDGGPATAAQLRQPHSIAVDGEGAVYVADIGNHRIRRIDAETGIIESIAGTSDRELPHDGQTARGNPILGPRALCIDENTLWIALREGHSVWRMDLNDGFLHHVAGTGEVGFAGDGGPAKSATFNGPKGIAIDSHGNPLVVDSGNNAIRKIDSQTGTITTIAFESMVANSTTLQQPHGISVGPDGAIYVGDTLNHRVLRVK